MAKALKSVRADISNGALKADELPSRIKILNWGPNKTLDGDITLDAESYKVFYANQSSIGRAFCPLDFNHNTVPGTTEYKNDKAPRAIAAYGVPTIYPDDGMYMEYLQWTPSGIKSAKDFQDLSPAVLLDDNNRVIGMHSCALTPAGSIENLSFYSADDSVTSLMGQLRALDADAEDDDKKEKAKDAEDNKGQEKKVEKELAENKVYSSEMAALTYSADHKSEYGDVDYADSKNHKYPINTEAHVRAAWSYIHMPKNHAGYTGDEVETIKKRIAAKAKHYGIELKAASADAFRHTGMGAANAYVQDPYKGIDHMLDESLEYFRKQLGMDDTAHPTDIMKAIRAKWEGLVADKQVLPEKTANSSTDPENRGEGDMAKKEEPESKRLVIAYNAEMQAKIAALEAKITPLSAELTTLKSERDAASAKAIQIEKDSILAEASKAGKIVPLSAEEIAETPLKLLRSIVDKLPADQVAMTSKSGTLVALSADGTVPKPAPGARQRSSEAATRMFADLGVLSQGPIALGTAGRRN